MTTREENNEKRLNKHSRDGYNGRDAVWVKTSGEKKEE